MEEAAAVVIIGVELYDEFLTVRWATEKIWRQDSENITWIELKAETKGAESWRQRF